MRTLWYVLVQPKVHYFSQFWSVLKNQRFQHSNLFIGLSRRKLLAWEASTTGSVWRTRKCSQNKKRERCMIVCVWNIIENLVPVPSQGNLRVTINDRRGRSCSKRTQPTTASKRIQSLLSANFTYNGSRLFNLIPADISELTHCTAHKFKNRLDKVLMIVTDESPVHGCTACCRAQ